MDNILFYSYYLSTTLLPNQEIRQPQQSDSDLLNDKVTTY